jgi:hypothetical protein
MAKRTNMRTGKAASKTKRGVTGSGVAGTRTGAPLRARAEGFKTPAAGRTAKGVGAYGQQTKNRISGVGAVTGVPVGNSPRAKGDASASRAGSHGQKTIKRSNRPQRLKG